MLPAKQLIYTLIISFLALYLTGCPTPNATKTTSTAKDTPTDSADSVVALEKLGAKLKKSGANVKEVDFRTPPKPADSTDEDQVPPIEISSENLKALAGLPSLTSLKFNDTGLNSDMMGEIGALTKLTHLDLRGCPITDEGIKRIEGLTNLRALRFSGKSGQTDITDDSMPVLAKFGKLKVLAIDFLKFAGSAEGFAELKTLPIEELYASNTLLNDESLAVIAEVFPNLKKLRASGCQVSDEGLKSIALMSKLEELDLSENTSIFDTGLAHISGMKQLKKLNLWRVPVTDEGVKHLADLTNLEWLNLDNVAYLSDEGLPSLKAMTKLKFLHLGSTAVTDEGMKHLTPLTALDDLKVTRTGVTEEGVAELKKSLTNTAVQLKYEGT